MKTIVLYATNNGASQLCATIIQEEIENCDIFNIEEVIPALEEYDQIVIGAGVKNNTIYKPMRDFLKQQHDFLLGKKCAYFICNEKVKKIEEITTKVFKQDLREHAIFVEAFGGYKESWVPKKAGDELRGIHVEQIKAAAKLLAG
ncbi:flavodoxin domain-containing protein [Enterococcus sp. BWR-S5]|uniref:flavodoxin domain-containing protein n=1 Tax=Enterococcus sp. BWR-S5 TaxID=2787714 RepID=UPI001923A5A9|nr:flavodoxin domain-containing protein [Enterococcus sp. BWR-S5]MBL1225729.1 flavodoxin [Enterococcus sp. BWR-S5]